MIRKKTSVYNGFTAISLKHGIRLSDLREHSCIKRERDQAVQKLAQTERELEQAEQKLAQTERELEQAEQKLAQTERELEQAVRELAQVLEELDRLRKHHQKLQ